MPKKKGHISREVDAHPHIHELLSAEALAHAGHKVVFLTETKVGKSADILLDGERWEIKSPISSTIRAIDRNIHKAIQQANGNVIIDSLRIAYDTDNKLLSYLTERAKFDRGLNGLIFIDKARRLHILRHNNKETPG